MTGLPEATFAITIGALLLLIFLIILLGKPLKWIIKLVINSITGFIVLLLVNTVGGIVGIHLDFTIINALVTGVFGVPGIVFLLFIRYLL